MPKTHICITNSMSIWHLIHHYFHVVLLFFSWKLQTKYNEHQQIDLKQQFSSSDELKRIFFCRNSNLAESLHSVSRHGKNLSLAWNQRKKKHYASGKKLFSVKKSYKIAPLEFFWHTFCLLNLCNFCIEPSFSELFNFFFFNLLILNCFVCRLFLWSCWLLVTFKWVWLIFQVVFEWISIWWFNDSEHSNFISKTIKNSTGRTFRHCIN